MPHAGPQGRAHSPCLCQALGGGGQGLVSGRQKKQKHLLKKQEAPPTQTSQGDNIASRLAPEKGPTPRPLELHSPEPTSL